MWFRPGRKPNSISNLRPISLTSTLCKLLERMVLTRLNYHLKEENLGFFVAAQTGFRPGLCTQDSLLLLHRLVGGGRRGRLKTPGVLVAVDRKKAFDTVAHSVVLTALKKAGVGARIGNFVRSFLAALTFEINSGSRHPKTFPNASGGTQGAILSPVVFNLVMRGLAVELRKIPHLYLTFYADDITTLLRHHGVEVRVNWLPGHAGGVGNEAANALACEKEDNRSVPAQQALPAPGDPDPTARFSAAKREWRRTLREQVPANDHPLAPSLPCGAQVLINKARANRGHTCQIVDSPERPTSNRRYQCRPGLGRRGCSRCIVFDV
ncbi:uncharacterized protein ISCGN_019453 [Ixodes scapularis]